MRRLLSSLGLAAILLLGSAIALAAPTPSPGLDGILLKPPGTGYKEEPKATQGIIEGPFDAAKYAEVSAAPDPALAAKTLTDNGFLTGFGRTWVSAGNAHVFVEAIISFNGAKGAKTWLRQSEAADKADPSYVQALTITGIDTYYGARLVDKVHKIYGDAFVFVKGNDVVLVTYVSNKNDVGTIAATQTRKQYDATPPYTIPPAEWPESKVVASSPFSGSAFKTIGLVVGILFLLGLIAAGGFILWSRRRPALQAIPAQQTPPYVAAADQGAAAPAEPAFAVALPAAVAAPMAMAESPTQEGPFVMSEDRLYWWDGAAWRDAEHEVPAAAQRSEDGNFWWDGEAWRAMPASPASPSSPFS
ncbi:MAG: hypothetical protein ABI959_02545 [Candidatus Dormiibacterota bacterium]